MGPASKGEGKERGMELQSRSPTFANSWMRPCASAQSGSERGQVVDRAPFREVSASPGHLAHKPGSLVRGRGA